MSPGVECVEYCLFLILTTPYGKFSISAVFLENLFHRDCLFDSTCLTPQIYYYVLHTLTLLVGSLFS